MNAAEAFIAYIQQHGEVSEALRNFQSSYRGYFVGSAEEFTHSQKQATACTLVAYLLQDNLVRNV